jgi:hypothetical protein
MEVQGMHMWEGGQFPVCSVIWVDLVYGVLAFVLWVWRCVEQVDTESVPFPLGLPGDFRQTLRCSPCIVVCLYRVLLEGPNHLTVSPSTW